MHKYCSSIERIDIENVILEAAVNTAIKAYEHIGCDYKLAAYVMMIGICPLIDGCYSAGTDISFSNPLQGLLFHWIVVNFFVYGCEKQYFKFKGLSTIADEGSTSECAQVRALSVKKYTELVTLCESRRLKLPDFDAYFFKFNKTKVILEADRQAERGVHDNIYDDDAEISEEEIDNEANPDDKKDGLQDFSEDEPSQRSKEKVLDE